MEEKRKGDGIAARKYGSGVTNKIYYKQKSLIGSMKNNQELGTKQMDWSCSGLDGVDTNTREEMECENG